MNISGEVKRYYHGQEDYNCAQTIARIFRGDEVLFIQEMRAFGGGRAPENRCGALHAALFCVEPSRIPYVRARFRQMAGAEQCGVLKKELHLPCINCVEIAVRICREERMEHRGECTT